jgi:dephospho-CoA kinase
MPSHRHQHTLAVGITGGIGSGKTTVCNIFAALGSKVLFSDDLAKRIMNTDPSVKKKIQKEFGTSIYTSEGQLDKKQLAKLIFHDPVLKERLEAIVHPATIKQITTEIDKAKQENTSPLLCIESALLFEAKLTDIFDYIIVVDAPEPERIRRVISRDSVTRGDVVERLRLQIPPEQKRGMADFVITNSSDMKSLESNCTFLYGLLTSLSHTPSLQDDEDATAD